MERTQTEVVHPTLAERNEIAYDLYDIGRVEYPFPSQIVNHLILLLYYIWYRRCIIPSFENEDRL